jgi:DNA-binding SARP family transcriptional activator
MLRIYLLGPTHLENDALTLPQIATQKATSLFAYLVTHPAKDLSREFLADLLWPDRPAAKARHSLHTALWQIRHIFKKVDLNPDKFMETSNTKIVWYANEEVWLDVAHFEDGCTEGSLNKLEDAVNLYRGPFLINLYEDWCINERYRLEELYLQALNQLAQVYYERRNFSTSLKYARQLISQDPLRESAHRMAMRDFYQLGQRVAAIEQFNTCAQYLRSELDLQPSEDTAHLYQEIMQETLPHLPASNEIGWLDKNEIPTLPATASEPHRSQIFAPDEIPFTGRNQQLDLLGGWWVDPQKPIAIIFGENGCGKSRLAMQFVGSLKLSGVQISWGRGYPISQTLSYQAISEALRSLLASTPGDLLKRLPEWVISSLSSLLPELRETIQDIHVIRLSQVDEAHLFEAVNYLLTELSQSEPVILVIDDLNWAAESSQQLIEYLVHKSAPRGGESTNAIRILATCGPEDMAPENLRMMLHRLRHENLLMDLRLSALDLKSVTDWVERWSGRGDQARELATRLFHETEGNPFFITETIKTLFETGQLSLERNGWSGPALTQVPDSLPLPVSVRELIYERIERLSRDSALLLQIASVIGLEFDFNILQQAWSQSEEETLTAIDDLLRAHLILESQNPRGHDYEFNHQMVQEAAYARLSKTRCKSLHRRVAQALEKVYGEESPASLLYHYQQAGDLERAFGWGVRAGERALELTAYQDAIEYFHEAEGLLGEVNPPPAVEMDLYAGLARACEPSRQAYEMVSAAKRMMGLAQREGDIEAQIQAGIWLGWGLALSGDPQGAQVLAETQAQAEAAHSPLLLEVTTYLDRLANQQLDTRSG